MKKYISVAVLSTILLSGCASGLNSIQKHEMDVYKEKGLAIEEKNPSTGAALGFLPGGGSFYSRNYGLGVLNLLLWPISICWDPISGSDGSESLNYNMTVLHVKNLRSQQLDELEDQLRTSKVTLKNYTLEKARIERKYSGSL